MLVLRKLENWHDGSRHLAKIGSHQETPGREKNQRVGNCGDAFILPASAHRLVTHDSSHTPSGKDKVGSRNLARERFERKALMTEGQQQLTEKNPKKGMTILLCGEEPEETAF